MVQVVDDLVLVFSPGEPTRGLPPLKRCGTQDGPKKKGKDLIFVFDRVLGRGPCSRTCSSTPRTASWMACYNCSVFAYGAMGAGKTHTLVGHHGDPGIMYLTTVELYRLLEALQEEKPFEVLVSYLEVYNEQIHDLLQPKGPLSTQEDSDRSVVVQGLSFHPVQARDTAGNWMGGDSSDSSCPGHRLLHSLHRLSSCWRC